MKGEYVVILVASICAVLVGIIDAAVDSYFFHSGSFLDLFLFNIPPHDLVFRIVIVIFMIAMGIVSAFFTKMRRLEREQLKKTGELYRLLTENARDLIYRIRIVPDMKFEYVSPAAGTMIGYTPEDHYADPQLGLKIVHPDDIGLLNSVISSSDYFTRPVILRWIRKDGSIVWTEQNNTPIYDKSGTLIAIEGIARDITERKKMEEELQIRAQMLDNATDSIILLDRSGTILYANKITCESRGYRKEELIGQNIMLLGIPEQVINTPDLKATDAAKNSILETVNQRKDGTIFPIEVNSKIIIQGNQPYILSLIRDISVRKQIQDQLIITDRLSSLGNLVLSLSHELNNPLSSVIGYAQLLLSNKEITQPVKNDIEKILSQARRVADIIRNFNEFGKESSSERQKVDINSTINSVLVIRSYELNSKNITVNTSFEPDLPQVSANIAQLLQVFLDLILNAEFFMYEAHQKGLLTITTKKVDDMIKATVTDDGPGIKPENLSHIFDPFYTTKEVGIGTGLGLTIAHRIITDHGGTLDIKSQPDQGTTVTIQLPIAQDMVYNK